MYNITTKILVKLSEQECLDCGGYNSTDVCKNATEPSLCMKWANTNAINLEAYYPYNAQNNNCTAGSKLGGPILLSNLTKIEPPRNATQVKRQLDKSVVVA
jgi:hypothetical protein